MKRAAKITPRRLGGRGCGHLPARDLGFPPIRRAAPHRTGIPALRSPDPTATPPITELPAWAQESRPWIIYPEGFRCQGTEGCPNDFRALIGEPGDVLPADVEYYDPAKHDYNPDDPSRFVVMPRPDDGIDLGRRSGAQGYAVVSGADTSRVASYMVATGDSLGAIGERFAIDPTQLTKDGEPVIPGETRIDPGDLLTFP